MGTGRIRRALAAALLSLAVAQVAYAHGVPTPLAFYGGFDPVSARCQRAVGLAAERCSMQAVTLRNACMNAQVNGQSCDTASVDAAVEATYQQARDIVGRLCSNRETLILGFGSESDAQRDVANSCHDLETAALSATFGPAINSGSVASADETRRACMAATAKGAATLLRRAARERRHALDRIVANEFHVVQEKLTIVFRAAAHIGLQEAAVRRRIAKVCSETDFQAVYERSFNDFLDGIVARSACLTSGTYVQEAVSCPASACGNGIQEPGEECDDGNGYDADACRNDCRKNNCALFPSTFDLIQAAIFEQHGCTNQLCHGEAAQGGLDLRKPDAYTHLVDVPAAISDLKRVEPGDENRSLLWLKLAAATLQRSDVPGAPMPQGLPALSDGELEALRLWIYSGAPQTGVVRGTAELLNACLPAPEPLQIRPPAAPAPGTGVQLHMPRWTLPGNSEAEVCFSTYYDVSGQVPADALSPDGTSFRYKAELVTQDPLSHHLIANLYRGEYPPDDPSWGPYLCVGGAHAGEPCNPLQSGGCGVDGECATQPVPSVACIGQGPPDNQFSINSFGFTGTQKTVAFDSYPGGVYAELPLRGVIVWNSHAFNLASEPGKLEAWLNFYFASRSEQQYPLQPLVNTEQVFAMHAAAFATDEVCNLHVFPEGTQLFELGSHMHKRGKRFRIFRGAFTCDGGSRSGKACSPLSPDLCAGAPCREPTGRDGNTSLLYQSLIYNDPAVLRFDPPLALSGPTTERTFTYCALYDNGFTNPAEVKRKSTSPLPPLSIGFGGPCLTPTHCVTGQLRAPCSGHTQAQRHASCDSSPGAGDGLCDACPLGGGVTTDDEMFVLLGSYFLR